MLLRKVPGCLALGLLASLAVHAFLYGGEHPVGGVYHAVLMQISLATALGFVVVVGAFAWSQSGCSTVGSVLAAHLRERLPGVGSVIASTAAWYVGAEAVEPHHAGVPAIALAVVLVVASSVVLRFAHAITDAIASVAIAIFRRSFSPRAPAWCQRPGGRLIPRRAFLKRCRYARPPPIASALARA